MKKASVFYITSLFILLFIGGCAQQVATPVTQEIPPETPSTLDTALVEAEAYEVEVLEGVGIPMRDGTILRANIYQPKTEGKFPVLVDRSGYDLTMWCSLTGEFYATRGYVFVGQNVRGTFASEGRFHPWLDDAWGENRDGYDTIEWVAKQPWSNGNVGMLRGSYSGLTQYLVAPTRPPHLTALFALTGWGSVRNMIYRDGAYRLSLHRWWSMWEMNNLLQHKTAPPGMEVEKARLKKAYEEEEEYDAWIRHLPLKSFPPLEGLADWYFEHLKHPEDGPYWWQTDLSKKYSEVDVPIVHFNGWYDYRLDATLKSFQGIRNYGRSEASRNNQRLIVGPWTHFPDGDPTHIDVWPQKVGELDFGPSAEFNGNDYRLSWYDYWLKGIENGIMDDPPVRIFLMGRNQWLDLDTWPPPGIAYQNVYLRKGSGKSETSLNNGGLTFEVPGEDELSDSFEYDPENPIPTLGEGPVDFRSVEDRMLTYTSEVLEHDLTIIGPVRAVLYGKSSAQDTDWIVRLCDVWPDGRSMMVCEGIIRARYRNSFETEELMVSDTIYKFEVDLWATAQVFQAGHGIRVQITSSDFPKYDRNLNIGESFGEEDSGQVAINTVFYNKIQPSHLVLPVIPD